MASPSTWRKDSSEDCPSFLATSFLPFSPPLRSFRFFFPSFWSTPCPSLSAGPVVLLPLFLFSGLTKSFVPPSLSRPSPPPLKVQGDFFLPFPEEGASPMSTPPPAHLPSPPSPVDSHPPMMVRDYHFRHPSSLPRSLFPLSPPPSWTSRCRPLPLFFFFLWGQSVSTVTFFARDGHSTPTSFFFLPPLPLGGFYRKFVSFPQAEAPKFGGKTPGFLRSGPQTRALPPLPLR